MARWLSFRTLAGAALAASSGYVVAGRTAHTATASSGPQGDVSTFRAMEECISRGSVRDLKSVVRRSGLDPLGVRSETGKTLLMVAAAKNRTTSLGYLLRQAERGGGQKEEINHRERNTGLTALHYACWKGNVGSARALLENGASATVRDNYGIAPLHKAIAFNQLQILRMIINDTTKEMSPEDQRTRRAELANFKTGEVSCPPEYQAEALIDTPMHLAARMGNVKMMSFLAQNGADPFVTNRRGDLPLHCAVRQKRVQAVDFLLKEQRKSGFPIFQVRNNKSQRPADACSSLDLECVSVRARVKLAEVAGVGSSSSSQ
mmetsp:Transcript_19762/g.27812  ORF Transcript_19762/g.27812 Transcript_19762/m.27812 type:complete len:319 (-) Transcript_19762:191-1147(-)